jgi:hypothetical protein
MIWMLNLMQICRKEDMRMWVVHLGPVTASCGQNDGP